MSWTNYSCPLLNEIYRLTQTAHMTARDDARRFESRPCSCVGPSVDAAALRTSEIFAHQAWTRWLGSADRVLLLTLASPLLHDWMPPHKRYTVFCRSVRCFLPGSAHMQTTLEEVTLYSSCLSKSESSRTVSKRREQHEAFLKKASYNICVWWSLCWVIISLLQQTVSSLWRGCFLLLLLEIMLLCCFSKINLNVYI